jgi:hypothetical protein
MSITKEEQAAFVAAMMINRKEINRLKRKLAAAEKRAAEVKALFKAVEVQVLTEMIASGEAPADADCGIGLEGEAFELWLARTTEIEAARGYVTEDGTCRPGFNGSMMVREAENAILDFIMSIVPAKLGRDLIAGLDSWKWREKMIKIAKAA